MPTNTFKLFANCIPVKGARRSLLCDLQRERIKLIPNSLHEMLVRFEDCELDWVKAQYNHEFDDEIDEYFQFLIDDEWGFWCDEPQAFPKIRMGFETSESITNAILDWDRHSTHDLLSVLPQLEDLGCSHLLIRCFDQADPELLTSWLQAANRSRLRSIELIVAYTPGMDDAFFKDWLSTHRRLFRITVHGAPEERILELDEVSRHLSQVVFQTGLIDSHHHCGAVSPDYFTKNILFFMESQSNNNCLNKKISVDAAGYIVNCPSLDQRFGHVDETRLEDALHTNGFTALWQVSKDQVEVCRDCEFRYVCSDCRAFVLGDAATGKPAKCNYNPYTAAWENKTETGVLVV